MSIQSTRHGYFYQDLCAIRECLQYYIDRNVAAIFVDYEYNQTTQKSFDIRIILPNSDEIIYEVKAGDKFKTTRSKVADAFSDLIGVVNEGTSNRIPVLLVSPELKSEIADYWSKLIYLREHSTLTTDTARVAIELFATTLPADLYRDHADLHTSLRLIRVETGESPVVANGNRYSPLCNDVIGKIKILADHFGINCPNNSVFTEDILLHQLVFAVQSHAGTNVDLLPEVKRLMINFFALYRMPTTNISGGSGGSLDDSRKLVERKMAEFENPATATSQALTATISISEGSALLEVEDE